MINLSRHFKTAADPLNTDMTSLLAELGIAAPRLDLKSWRTSRNNCYNFALDRMTDDYLQPGQAVDKTAYRGPVFHKGVEEYWASVRRGVEADGLRGIGYDFGQAIRALRRDEILSTLFIRESSYDYHWFGLRQKADGSAVWAHKIGASDAESCEDTVSLKDRSGMIEAAMANGYKRFAGYYAMPAALAMPPRAQRA